MKRIHLFEFEDQSWFPGFLRNYMTDFLQFLSNKTPMWKPVAPLLAKLLANSGSAKIVDLASGGGGGLLRINQDLLKHRPDTTIVLTDLYPNQQAFEFTAQQAPNLKYLNEPVNALQVPTEIQGAWTMFLGFHHLKPQEARQLLQNALDSGNAIGIFEAQERSLLSLLAMFVSPLTVLLSTPWIRPFSIGRLVFTYLIPVVPLFVLWDGVVSAMRTYSVQELKQLVGSLRGNERFVWEINKIKSGPGVVIYLLGHKKLNPNRVGELSE
jgi:hypothetical protein